MSLDDGLSRPTSNLKPSVPPGRASLAAAGLRLMSLDDGLSRLHPAQIESDDYGQ
jgi:hypothetical protein